VANKQVVGGPGQFEFMFWHFASYSAAALLLMIIDLCR